MKIENNFYTVELSETLSLTIHDKRYGGLWHADAPFQLRYGGCWDFPLFEHAQHRVEANGHELQVCFSGLDCYARFKGHPYRRPQEVPPMLFRFTIRLEEDAGVEFAVDAIDGLGDEDVEVTFPFRLFACSTAEEAIWPIPSGYGVLLRFPETRQCAFDMPSAEAVNMPFYGILPKRTAGLAVYMKDGCDLHTHVEINCTAGVATCSPVFNFNARLANYRRRLRVFAMPPDSGYNRLAKWYRAIAASEHRLVTLEEKIRRNPEVEKLVGAVIWKHDVFCLDKPPLPHDYSYFVTSPDGNSLEGRAANWSAAEIFETARKNGFDRVCVYNTGWNAGGYDSMYPTRLPPNPERGTPEAFCAAARDARSLSDGYVLSVHDNYYDAYRNSPEFSEEEIGRNDDGGLQRGAIWRGGRAWLLCSECAVKYAARDLPQIAAMTGRGSIFLDVFGSAMPHRCFASGHPHGQREDYDNRRRILSMAKELFGSVATEQTPHDFCADIVDLGVCSPFGGAFFRQCPLPMTPIPLWQLVYHDCVLNYTPDSAFYESGNGEYLALCTLYCMLPTAFTPECRELSVRLRRAYVAEMLSHEFLTPPDFDGVRLHAVARTTFADGTVVVANLSHPDFEYCGRVIAANQAVILQ